MNLFQRSVYKMKSKNVIDYMSQTTDTDEGPIETIAIVTETSTMPRQDMLEAQVWSSFIQVCHMSGLSSQISRYLRKAHNVSYQDFYDNLYTYATQDAYLKSKLEVLRSHYNHWMDYGYLPHPVTEEISQTGVNLITSLLLVLHLEKKINHVHDIVESFVNYRYPDIDDRIRQSLYDYQRCMVVTFDDLTTLPKIKKFSYDFHGYLDYDEDLQQSATMEFDFHEKKN
jgi:hypothetical protein